MTCALVHEADLLLVMRYMRRSLSETNCCELEAASFIVALVAGPINNASKPTDNKNVNKKI